MTKMLLGIMVMSLLTATSCKKTPDPGGSWTFEGNTYFVGDCSAGANGALNANNINANNTLSWGSVSVYFHDSLPTVAGTYAVVKYPPAAGKISFGLSTFANTYTYGSTGGNGAETANVKIVNGLVNVYGSGITMLNSDTALGSDSSALYLNITQTQ